VKQSLADLFTSGKVNLDDFNDIKFRDFDKNTPEAIAKTFRTSMSLMTLTSGITRHT